MKLDSYSDTLPQLRKKTSELQIEKSSLVAACTVLRARRQEAPSASNAHENKVRQLLGQPTVTDTLSDDDQLQANLQKLEIINAAISTLAAETLKQTALASNKLIESKKSEINRLGSAFANAFAELHARHLEYDQLIDDLEDVGASVGMFRIRPNGLSHPKDRSGAYAYGLNEFIDAGYYSKSSLPKVLK